MCGATLRAGCTKLQLHALVTINSKERNWDLLENTSVLSTCPEILKTQNRPEGEFCAHLEVIRLFQSVGCARNRLVSHAFQQNLELSLLIQVSEWMEFPLSIFGTSLLECCVLLPTNQRDPKRMYRKPCRMTYHHENKPRTKVHTPNQYNDLELCNVDFVSSNVKSSQSGAMLYISEDSDAVIKMIIKGRSPTIRHVSRTCRVALDWLFDRINLDSKILIKYVDTKKPNRRQTDKGQFDTS